MDDKFVAAEEARRKLKQRTEIYDVTAWSLPLLFNVEAIANNAVSTGSFEPAKPSRIVPGEVHGGRGQRGLPGAVGQSGRRPPAHRRAAPGSEGPLQRQAVHPGRRQVPRRQPDLQGRAPTRRISATAWRAWRVRPAPTSTARTPAGWRTASISAAGGWSPSRSRRSRWPGTRPRNPVRRARPASCWSASTAIR